MWGLKWYNKGDVVEFETSRINKALEANVTVAWRPYLGIQSITTWKTGGGGGGGSGFTCPLQ